MPKKTSPRKRPLRLGFLALADCAPLVMAQELGLFAARGIAVELRREIGWATIRAKVLYGDLDAAQAPAGLMVAANCGINSIPVECLTALVLNLQGNAITLSQSLWRSGVRDGATLRKWIEHTGQKLTFGVVHSCSSHPFLLREWLRRSGIDPARDVRIVVVPPSQIVSNLKAGNLDGACVGEPWNSVAILQRIGWCVATSAELAPRHPEKVLMVTREFAGRAPDEHATLISALVEAAAWCDDSQNRESVAKTLAHRDFVNAPVEALRRSLVGPFDFGQGRTEPLPDFHIFSSGNANEPTVEYARWVARQLHACGLASSEALAPEQVEGWFRADLFHAAMSRRVAAIR